MHEATFEAIVPSRMGTGVAQYRDKAAKVETRRPSTRNKAADRRSNRCRPDEITPVRLTRKYAEVLNGISLSGHDVGDRLPLPARDARLLIAEGWASPDHRRGTDLSIIDPPDRRRFPR